MNPAEDGYYDLEELSTDKQEFPQITAMRSLVLWFVWIHSLGQGNFPFIAPGGSGSLVYAHESGAVSYSACILVQAVLGLSRTGK